MISAGRTRGVAITVKAVPEIVADIRFVSRTCTLRNGNRKSHSSADGEAENQIIQRVCNTDSRQRLDIDALAYHCGIHEIIQLLKE